MSNNSSGNQTRHSITPAASVRLLAAAPDLGDFLTPEEREEANRIALPTARLEGPVQISELLADTNSFAALVIEGMLLRQLRIGEQPTLRLFGPGELVATGTVPTSMLLIESEFRAVDATRVATLGIEFLASAHRWPRLIAGLQSRMADGQERLATQMAICQLPRVADRILAMLWLLAESWGHVSSSGTSLTLSLTHEALGALVGARRSTVTLAIRELTDRGALVHQDRSWLLLEPPPTPIAAAPPIDAPAILGDPASPWTGGELQRPLPDRQTLEMFRETLHRLRDDHRRNAEQHQAILRQMIRIREQNEAIRRRIRDQVVHYPAAAIGEPPAGGS